MVFYHQLMFSNYPAGRELPGFSFLLDQGLGGGTPRGR
jgi:hypothetical protein